MANVTNQTSLGVRCVGGGCTDIYKQVPGTTLSKIIRLKALHLKWSMFLTDRRLPVEPPPTHTHTVTRTKVVSSATGDHPRGVQFGPISHAASSTSEQLKDTAGCQ